MRRFATGKDVRLGISLIVGFMLATAFAFAPFVYAAFTPAGVTHHNLIGVYETQSPCTTARDRPIIEFIDADKNLMIVTWDDATKALKVVTAATCATLATTTTIAPTTTTVTTTTVTTTTT